MIDVVGLTARGWPDLDDAGRRLIGEAQLVIGSGRHLSLISTAARTAPLPSPLRAGLASLARSAERVVVLASGDPLLSGIGSTLIEMCGPDQVRVHPAVSSVALARARMGWPAETCAVVTVVGRSIDRVRRELAPGRRILVLSGDAGTPAAVARLLVDAGYPDSRLTVLGDLGTPQESRRSDLARHWSGASPTLNLLAVECVADPGAPVLGWSGGLPDDAYENDGQLTKRDVRAVVLARLAPRPAELLWDLGAGAGSVAIEWCRADATCRAVALERDPVRAGRITRNAARLGVPGVRVIEGDWPGRLAELPAPAAIFVGGGAQADSVAACWEQLPAGGRLVVSAVTWETEAVLAAAAATHGGELTRVSVEALSPLGRYRAWQPARPVVLWSVRK